MISFAVRYIKYAIVGLTALSCCAEATAETVELSSAGDSYIFENKRCSEVDTREITVGGRPFDATRDRLSIYGNGAIVIADGWTEPLTIYSEPGCQGPSRVLERDRFYRGELQGAESFLPEELLGDFDNGVRSFRLKRGFSCTMANNPDGTGYSRVYIAADDDIVVNTMPDGLDFVSFIRVCRHDWVGKRGVSGGDLPELTRSAWFYDWGAGAVSTDNCEYIPMRHNRWWDSWDNIGSRTNTSCVLGFNEPDHADQSDLGTEIAIEMWPEFMKSGLRIGSPAPDNISKDWLREFLAKADSLNYRVDFVATHMYLASQDPYTLANTINRLCRESYGGRPMWITEWNNGANWTNERWPDQKGPQRDADFNIIYDADGNTTEVARPHTPDNSEVQCAWLAKALDAFDKCDRLERHAFYSWVEDARAIVIDGKLTPAGRVFAEFNSRPGFNRRTQYLHRWRIAPPRISGIISNRQRVRVNFYDHNGETAVGYIVERRIDGGPWEQIAYLRPGTDYRQGRNTYFADRDLVGGLMEYRMKAVSYKGTESIYSRIVGKQIEAGADDIAADSGFTVRTDGDAVIIESDREGRADIYAVDGRLIRSVSYPAGTATIGGLSPGIYFVCGKKIAVGAKL